MIMFRSESDIYDWFQHIQGWNRMDFLCNLITLCNPFELRFIGACIEDRAQTDYNTLRDQEIKANALENLQQFMNKCPPVDEFRSHISVCLTLLQSTNYKVASKLAAVMEEKLDDLNLEHLMEAGLDAEVEQWMLMLTLAAYHPAFNFEKRYKFKKKLSEYGSINRKERKTFPQSTWCRRTHRCSQPPHSTADREDTEWRAEMSPDPVPFQSYSIYPEPGYGYTDYRSIPYQGNPIHASVQDGFTRLQATRPSTFPSPLTPLENGDTMQYGINYPQAIVTESCTLNSPRGGRTNLYNGPLSALPGSTQDFSSIAPKPPSTVECILPHNTALQQPTVSYPHARSNVTSVISTVLTTTVSTKTTSHSRVSGGEHLSWGSGYAVSTNKSRQYISKPNATNPVQTSNYSRFEIESQRSKNRNRSQSGDTSLGMHTWNKSRENMPNPDPVVHQLRISTSAPMLAVTKEEQTKSSSDFKRDKQHEKAQNLRNKNASPCLTTKDLKPMKVSVGIPESKKENPKPKGGTCFNLKVTWSDETISQCDHSVDEMVQFYKQVTGRIGKKAISIDFLARQNNQIQERREKLEEIFSEIVASTVTDSNLKQFMTFLNYKPTETPAPSSLPLKKRKYKTGSKSRVVLDESSSSSSTASPPLVSSDLNSRLVSPPNSRPESSLSPLSTKGSASGSSHLSSPTSVTNSSQISSRVNEGPLHEDLLRNDPYLKLSRHVFQLYFWLKERNLADTYTHFKSYTYDEFFKLQPSDVKKFGFLSSGQKAILNKEMAKMRNEVWDAEEEEEDATLGIDMGMLSLTSNLQTEENKRKDIRSILEDVARTASEDEKSSAPVEMPNTDDIQAIASNSCFSFEFDSSSATVDSSTRSKRSNHNSNATDMDIHDGNHGIENTEYYQAGNRPPNNPQRAWSQSDIRPPGYPFSTVYLPRSAPPLPQMAYFTRPFTGDQMTGNPMMMGCYISSQSSMTYHPPVSSTSTVAVPQHPTITQAPIVTVTSTVGQKQPQYYNVVSAAQPRAMYPLSGPYCPTHSMTSPMGDGMPIAPIAYDMTSPDVENSSSTLSTNLEFSERVSPESSDPDSSLKASDGPRSQATSDAAVFNKNIPPPTNFFYNPVTRFHYNVAQQPQWVPVAPPFSDPSSFVPKKKIEYGDYSRPVVTGGSFTANGYVEIRSSCSMPSIGNNRTLPHVRHYSGDTVKKMNALSCCNCGRKGHDASSCRDPNAVEVLGKDFHLKVSQSQPPQGR